MATRALGTLTLDMLVKMGGFVEGMSQAQRVTDQRTKEMQKSLQTLEDSFTGIRKAAVSLAGALGVGITFKNIIDQTVNFQKEQAQLEAVLRSTGRTAELSTRQLNDMARSMAAVGGGSLFSEGEISQAQARLLSYTGIVGDQFPAAMQAAVDMATRLGTDVSSAAETIGRALDVPSQGLTALTRQGFRFTDEQKKLVLQLERTGKTAEAQKIILGQLTSAYGGAAAAARDTLGGALAALRENFNSLFIDASGGNQLKEMVEDLNSVLSSDLAKGLAQGALTAMQTLLPTLSAVATAYAGIWGTKQVGVMVKNIFTLESATVKAAQAHLAASQQALVLAQQETALAAKIALSAQGTNAQTIAVLNLVKARQAEAAATTAVTAATTRLNVAASALGKVISLFGGWMGMASLAIGIGVSALISYRDKTVEVKETILDLNQPLKDVTAQFKALSLIQKQAEIATISNNQIANAHELATTLREINKIISEEANQPWRQGLLVDAETASSELAELIREDNALRDEMRLYATQLSNIDLPYDEWSDALQKYLDLVKSVNFLSQEQKNTIISSAGTMDKLRQTYDAINEILRAYIQSLRVSKTEMNDAARAALAMDKSMAAWMGRFATGAQRNATGYLQDLNEAIAQFGSDPQKFAEATKQLAAYYSGKAGGGRFNEQKSTLEDSLQDTKNLLREYERSYNNSLRNLELDNEQHLISMSSYYDTQRALLNEYTNAQIEALDQQIAAQSRYRDSAKSENERAQAARKLNDLLRERSELLEDAAQKQQDLNREEQKELQSLQRQFQQVDLSLMEHSGLLVEAAAIRFDDQYADLIKLAEANERWDIVAKIEQLKNATLQTTAFNQEVSKLQGMFSTLQTAEQMLSVTQQLGGVGEIAALRQLGELRRSQLDGVNASIDKLRALLYTDDGKGKATSELVQQLQQLELRAAQLKAGLDPLAAKFADIFSSGMTDPLYDFISGTKTASEAFTDMANKIIADLARIELQDALTGIFKGSGSGGGLFGWLGGLFANEKGGVYSGPGISAYSNSIVSEPTLFPFAKGGNVGLMGESGSEFIVPAVRTSDGSLGIKAVGQQLSEKATNQQFATSITVNLSDSGASSTVSSDNQSAQGRALAQAVDQAVRDRLAREMMQGGLIWKMRNGRN